MSKRLIAIALSAALLGSFLTPASAATEFYVKIVGAGSSPPNRLQTSQVAQTAGPSLLLYHPVTSQRDVATGQASGKRQYAPTTIAKEWGTSVPALGLDVIGCKSLIVSILIGLSQPSAMQLVSQAPGGGCLYSSPLPGAGPYKATLQASIPSLGNGFSFYAPPLSTDVKAGQTIQGTIETQVLGSQERFSLRWSPQGPPVFNMVR